MGRRNKRKRDKTRLTRNNGRGSPPTAAQRTPPPTMKIPEAIAIAVKHHQTGELDKAKGIYEQVVRAAPNHPDALHLLGVIAHQVDDNQTAVDYISRAIESKPDAAAFHCNLGVAYRSLERLEDAVASYHHALDIQPDYAEAHNNLGNVLEEQDRLDEAAASFTRALQLTPEYPEALANLANVLRAQGEYDRAIANCRQALQINPDYADAHNSLGSIFLLQRCFPEAEACFQRAVEINPQKHEWHNNLASALRSQGKIEEATAAFGESLRIEPDQPLVELSMATLCPIVFYGNWEIDQYHDKLLAALKGFCEDGLRLDLSDITTQGWELSWSLLFHGRDNRPVKEAMANVFRGSFSEATPAVRKSRPRVAFVVTNSHENIFLRYMRSILQRINADLFEVVIVCSSAGAEVIRTKIGSKSIEIMPLSGQLDRSVEMVREARFDLLYYWEVGTDAANYFLPFFRLAPIQCTGGGILATTGIPQMDYYLSSEHWETEDSESHYTETLIRTKTGLINPEPPAIPETLKPREQFGFTADQHIYLCPQKIQKLHPDLDPLLGGILRRDPQAVVVLLGIYKGHPAYKLGSRFLMTLPDVVNRIDMRGRLPFDDYLGMVAAADVILDPMHYGGGTTTLDSLALGKPVVTLPTEFAISRVALSYYRRMGITDCIASTPQEYIQIAVRLATDAEYRAAVSARIRQTSHVIFEETEPVRELEQVFTDLIQRTRSAQASGKCRKRKANKVFGVGLHKTGTTTLAECFRTLRFAMCPENKGYELLEDWATENYQPILELAEVYNAFEDSPWGHPGFYRHLDQRFPGSKFILTTRNVDNWLNSMKRWVASCGGLQGFARIWNVPLIHREIFGCDRIEGNEERYKEVFRRHHEEVADYFKDRQNDLLIVDWEKGDGWEEICAFLGRPVPTVAFPQMLKYQPSTGKYAHVRGV